MRRGTFNRRAPHNDPQLQQHQISKSGSNSIAHFGDNAVHLRIGNLLHEGA